MAAPDTPIVDADLAAADKAAEALAERARSGDPLLDKPSVSPERATELDDALAEVLKNSNPDGTGPKDSAAPAPELTPEQKAAADRQAAETAEAERKKAEALPKDDKPKGALDDLLADATAQPKDSKLADETDEIKLRSDASPKTRETFEKLKEVYKGRLDAATTQISDLSTRLKDVEAKLTAASAVKPEEVQALQRELAEHREFRVQFDTEHSTEFKQKYDTRIAANYEAIYERLTFHKLPAAELAALKAMPPDERDSVIEGFLEKLSSSPQSKRFIEAKLGDNLSAQDDRRRELEATRAKAGEILAAKAAEPVQTVEKRINAMSTILKPHLAGLDFMHLKEVPATLGAEEKKAVVAHNEFATYLQSLFKRAVLDDSVESRSDAALALPLAHYYKRELNVTRAQLKAANEELDGIKKAGRTSRIASTSAAPKPAGAAPKTNTNVDSGDAVDSLFAEITAAAPAGQL